MNKLIHWLENSFSPKMKVINNNVWITTLKDSIMQTLPFTFLGSIFSLLTILNDYFPNLPSFWTPYGWTMGMVGLFVSFLVPFNLMEKKRLRKQRINAGLSGLVLFLIIINPIAIQDGSMGYSHSALGAGGMFIAMAAGCYAGLIMSFFGKFSFFTEDSVIPSFVRAWFDSMLPVGIVVCTGWIAVDLLNVDIYTFIVNIFMPVRNILESPFGFSFVMFIYCFLYSMGISAWVMTPVTTPIMMAAIVENMEGIGANLVTSTTLYSAYLWIGGIGCTLPLAIMMLRSKSKKLGALGKATFVPSLFNINEPLVFAIVAWNPFLMIPMWIQGFVLPLIIWLFTKVIAFAPIPSIQFGMWYCPFPFSTWASTKGSINAVILALIVFAVAFIIWYPFYKAFEKQEIDTELLEAKEKESN